MVSGGTYGTEDIVHGAGYGKAILILLLTPILWSLPTAFMIGELSSALPFEGGYYAWVRRAMGNFWGFQEAWLSLVASIFDMAIYPTLFVLYLDRLFPWFAEGHRGVMVALAVVVVCALLNIAGVRVVSTTSLWLFFALSAPFIADCGYRALQVWGAGQRRDHADDLHGRHSRRAAHLHVELHGMGQRLDHRHRSGAAAADLSSRHAGGGGDRGPELHRAGGSHVDDRAFARAPGKPAPGRTSPGMLGGPLLRVGLALGGMISGFGMFNALVMSYSRLPLAMAQDGMLPQVFGKLHPRSRAPWVAILVCAIGMGHVPAAWASSAW